MTLYFWANLMLQIYRKRAYNSALFTYMYESGPGALVIFLRLVLLGWLWHALYTTHGNFPRKRGFYNKFGLLFSAYLVALPLLEFYSEQLLLFLEVVLSCWNPMPQ